MPQKRKVIPATAITNEQTLESLFASLMDFPGWHEPKTVEWIDMVMAGSNITTPIPHLQTAEIDTFVIEISDSLLLTRMPPLMSKLVSLIQKINQLSQERTGHPLLYLLFS